MKRVIFMSIPLLSAQQVWLEPPSYQEKIRGVYENKIRWNAAPEKVFETFASIKEGKKFYMAPIDLFHAMTPFNFSKASTYDFFANRESFIMSVVDANKDGKISFPEYFFFIVLLSTTASKFKRMIEKAGGSLTLHQFVDLMLKAKKKSPQGSRLVSSNGFDPRSTSITDEDFRSSCETLFAEAFTNDPLITWEKFRHIRDRIFEELLIYEFYRFPVEDETISAEDFGKSLVSYMPTSMIDLYLERLDKLKFEGRISLNEYLAFMFVMQESALIHQNLMKEHSERKHLSRKRIFAVLENICNSSLYCREKNYMISEAQLDIFIKLLDIDDSGTLEPEEIYSLITSRGSQGTAQTGAPNIDEVINELKIFLNVLLKFSGFTPYFKVKSH